MRVAAVLPPPARAAVAAAASAGTASGPNEVLLTAAAFAVVGAVAGFAFVRDPVPTATAGLPAPARP